MKYLLLVLPMFVVGCAGTDTSGYGYNEGQYGYNGASSTYAPGYSSGYNQTYSGYGYGQTYPSSRYSQTYPNGYNQSYAQNCGTPYEPRACPPMPRRPLPYYPDDR